MWIWACRVLDPAHLQGGGGGRATNILAAQLESAPCLLTGVHPLTPHVPEPGCTLTGVASVVPNTHAILILLLLVVVIGGRVAGVTTKGVDHTTQEILHSACPIFRPHPCVLFSWVAFNTLARHQRLCLDHVSLCDLLFPLLPCPRFRFLFVLLGDAAWGGRG